MAATKPQSWLQKAHEQMNIDVDWMDAEYIRTMPERLGITADDSTSNQLWVDTELHQPGNAALLKKVAAELKDKGWLHIYTRTAVELCKKNIDNIKGRVLLQTLPSLAYDQQATVDHARLYDAEFKRVGISRDRYCIKIPATGPALNAALVLAQDPDEKGLPIATLGTAIFCLAQAIAASQARMHSISPYFNEIPAHNDPSLWPKTDDPATQHPMSARVVQMLATYKQLHAATGQPQPRMKLASFLGPREVLAAAEMGCQSATVSPKLLDELAKLPYDEEVAAGKLPAGVAMTAKPDPGVEFYAAWVGTPERLKSLVGVDPLAAAEWDGSLASTEVDYLADGGVVLDRAVEKDPVAKSRLAVALEMFTAAEERSKARVESVLAEL